jgi:hypothetical protein
MFELVYSEQVAEKKMNLNLRRAFETPLYPIPEVQQEYGKRLAKVIILFNLLVRNEASEGTETDPKAGYLRRPEVDSTIERGADGAVKIQIQRPVCEPVPFQTELKVLCSRTQRSLA